jgi:hypothetical protein
VTQVQLDEMWNFIGRKHAREDGQTGESLPNSEDWAAMGVVSFAPEFQVDDRGHCGAAHAFRQGGRRGDQGTVAGSAFFSDGFMLSGSTHCCLPCRDDVCRTGKQGVRKPLCQPHQIWSTGSWSSRRNRAGW